MPLQPNQKTAVEACHRLIRQGYDENPFEDLDDGIIEGEHLIMVAYLGGLCSSLIEAIAVYSDKTNDEVLAMLDERLAVL